MDVFINFFNEAAVNMTGWLTKCVLTTYEQYVQQYYTVDGTKMKRKPLDWSPKADCNGKVVMVITLWHFVFHFSFHFLFFLRNLSHISTHFHNVPAWCALPFQWGMPTMRTSHFRRTKDLFFSKMFSEEDQLKFIILKDTLKVWITDHTYGSKRHICISASV